MVFKIHDLNSNSRNLLRDRGRKTSFCSLPFTRKLRGQFAGRSSGSSCSGCLPISHFV